ncbi:3931_t:CDS:2 [Diversispora eburnea]|uniref:3931_t:CDS:1 n=1 Tax=Diversispora eburnea TaxID=1213867 RepID=A0A9N9FC98_9GLOM|nr:3931_t:CDS:2 [Diversispora eburnea]
MTTESTEEKKSSRKRKNVSEETKPEGPSLPKLKEFLANAGNLKVVINRPSHVKEDHDDSDTKETKGTKSKEAKDKEGPEEEEEKEIESTGSPEASKNGESKTDVGRTTLFTFDAKPRKFATNAYGWSENITKGKIKIEIDGNEVELPVTVNLNITVHNSKK